MHDTPIKGRDWALEEALEAIDACKTFAAQPNPANHVALGMELLDFVGCYSLPDTSADEEDREQCFVAAAVLSALISAFGELPIASWIRKQKKRGRSVAGPRVIKTSVRAVLDSLEARANASKANYRWHPNSVLGSEFFTSEFYRYEARLEKARTRMTPQWMPTKDATDRITMVGDA